MPNVDGYTTKRKPHRVRPHFRYPTKTKLLEVERTAETAYLRAYEANMRHPTMRGAAQLVMKANDLTEARARSRSFYP
jgi:hypothetical protein